MASTKTKLSPMEASLQRLEALKRGSRLLHYKVARECSILLKDKDYLDNKRENHRRLDAVLEELLPGMTKTTLELMYDQFPNKADWDKLGFTEIRDRAFKSLENPRKSKTSPIETKVAKPSLTGKGQIDTTGRLNEGGGVGGLKVSELQEMRDQIASLSQENAELRQSRDEAYRRIGELEMELKKLRS